MSARRSGSTGKALELLAGSLLLTITSDVAVTPYGHPHGFPNYLGHVLKVASFCLVCKAVIETAITRPVDLLFRDLYRAKPAATPT